MDDGVYVLGLIIYIAAIIVPISMVVQKAGFSRLWALTAMVPFLNIIMLWVFALKEWRPSRN
jgi:phosphoglycerol transferase MdoB-like AlkP superfamily enzyme